MARPWIRSWGTRQRGQAQWVAPGPKRPSGPALCKVKMTIRIAKDEGAEVYAFRRYIPILGNSRACSFWTASPLDEPRVRAISSHSAPM